METNAQIPAKRRGAWNNRSVSELPDVKWLTIPDLTELLGLKVSQVRRLIEDRALLASRVDGVWRVPADFIVDGEPMSELKGTLVVLGDSGFSDEEAMTWLLTPEDSLGVSPIDALRAGRKAEVRRVAQALGF
nr:helix-turn-helix domain-containing protein [Galbitalea soli]